MEKIVYNNFLAKAKVSSGGILGKRFCTSISSRYVEQNQSFLSSLMNTLNSILVGIHKDRRNYMFDGIIFLCYFIFH